MKITIKIEDAPEGYAADRHATTAALSMVHMLGKLASMSVDGDSHAVTATIIGEPHQLREYAGRVDDENPF